ncbi:MAG: thioredoxin family protein [Succinivibrio sp.]|nr:thioredoxin family protein [Succinivibrio sp.]
MKFFNFRKKDQSDNDCKKNSCCCTSNQDNKNPNEDNCDLLVLGGGCKKCNNLEMNLKEALKEMELELTVGHVTDFAKIASYGVMQTPALVYKGKVLCYGVDGDKNFLINLLKKEL